MNNNNSSENRRKLLKSIATGSGAIVAGKSLPESWSRPVVDSVILPTHAQTSGGASSSSITLTSNGTITNVNTMAPVTDNMVAEKNSFLDSLVPSAHAAVCAVADQCGRVDFTGGNSGVLIVSNVGDSPFILDGSNAASGTVGNIPYTVQLDATRTSGSVAFQGACSGYGVTLGTRGSCTPVTAPSPGGCSGVTAEYLDRIIISFDQSTGDYSARGGPLNSISNYSLESLLLVWDDDSKFRFNGNGGEWFSLVPQGTIPYGPFSSTLTARVPGTGPRTPDPNKVYTLSATVTLCGDRTIGISGLSIVKNS